MLLQFKLLGQGVQVHCSDLTLHEVVAANFGGMILASDDLPATINYYVERDASNRSFLVSRDDQRPLIAEDTGTLVYLLEKDLTVVLQHRRPDLLFLHAAAFETGGRVFLIAAESGIGKSTTTWGLLHQRVHYLSDELSPINLETMRVFPYPHALCLKQAPPEYPLPEQTIDLGRTLHVPTAALPSPTIKASRPLGGVFVLNRPNGLRTPLVKPLSAAEASARLYITALNALAHDNRGLDAIARIAQQVPCFMIEAADLTPTCSLICTVVDDVIANGT